MSTALVTERIAEGTPRSKARIAGTFWLATFIAGVVSLIVRNKLVVSGDAAATAANILVHPALFRLSFTLDIIATPCYIVVTALVYELFKPVNGSLSLLQAFFSLVGCAIGALSCVSDLAPIVALEGAKYLSVFGQEQLEAMVLVIFKLGLQVNGIALIFFGIHCLLIGYLIFRSTFLPRFLGVLMAFAGLGYLTFLSPPLAQYLAPYNLLPGAFGELALTVWLLACGVNGQRWTEQAIAAGERRA